MPTSAANPNTQTKDRKKVDLVSAQVVEKQTLTDIKYKLSNALQSSLDLRDTTGSFYEMLQKLVVVSGMTYQYDGQDADITHGQQKQHSATYNLSADTTPLGKITFYRNKRFQENELETIEAMIGILVFPLRNALLYREALANSLKDSLTQIGNRMAMELCLKREFNIAKRYKQTFSCLMLDIDHFKRVNDTYGHQAGDIILKKVAVILSAALRKTDQIFRYGGEEFLIILANTQHDRAVIIAERIRHLIQNEVIRHEEESIMTSVSVGVSTLQEGDSRNDLLKRLDDALYQAKSNGRNCVVSENHLPKMPLTLKTAQ